MIHQIINDYRHVISSLAEECGISWEKVEPLLDYNGRSFKRGIEISKSYRGKVWVKSGRISAAGVEYPLITFKTKKHGELTQVFNGLEYFKQDNNLKHEFKPKFTPPPAQFKPTPIDADEIRKKRTFETTIARFKTLPRENGDFAYLVKKFGIQDASFYDCDLRRDGASIIYPIKNHLGEIQGFQQIFAEKIKGTDRDKNYIGKTGGGFVVIGDETRIYKDGAIFCEGFATGVACYHARAKRGNFSNDDALPVVVCLDAGNMMAVTKSFYSRGCNRLIIAADNDEGSPNGNTGIYVGMKVAREVGGILYYPVLARGGKCDFCDTLNAPKIDLSKGSEYNYLRELIRFAPKQQLKELSRKLAYAIARECPKKMTVEMACATVNAALAERGYTATLTVKSIIMRDVKKRSELVRAFNKIRDEKLTEHDLSGLTNEEIANHILESDGGIWYDNRGLGAGKTNLMIAISERLQYDNCAYITHRVGLVKDACKRFDYVNYEEVSPQFYTQKLGVCVNSIPKFNVHQRFRVLFIDEARQVIEHILSGSVENRQAVLDEFILAIQSADLVIVSDADLDDATIRFFKKHASNKSHNHIQSQAVKNDKTLHLVANHKANMNNVLKVLNDGRNAIVASTSINKTKELETFLLENGLTEEQILVVHSENRGNEKQSAFLTNPNEECVKYRCVIHSPTIGSGVSITTPHFDFNFLMSCGNLPANEAMQMTARNRMSKHVFVSFSEQKNSERVVDEELLIEGESIKCARYMVDKGGGIFGHNELGNLKIALYTRVNRDLNDFANNFVLLAEINGMTVNYERLDSEMDYIEEARLSGLSTRSKEKTVEDIFTSEIISELAAEQLSEKTALTQKETNQLKRHMTTKMVGVDKIERDDVKNFEGGMMKILGLYEIWQAEPHQLKAWDLENHKTKDKRYSKVSLNRLLVELFDVAASDSMIVTDKTAKKFCDALKKNAAELAANGMGNYNKNFKRPMQTMSIFLKRFGLELVANGQEKHGKRARVFLLKENKTISRYATNRAASVAHY